MYNSFTFPLKEYQQNTKMELCSNIIVLLNLYIYTRSPKNQQDLVYFPKQTSHLLAAEVFSMFDELIYISKIHIESPITFALLER